jgi:hypothetical protein
MNGHLMGFSLPHHGSPQKEPEEAPSPPSGPLLFDQRRSRKGIGRRRPYVAAAVSAIGVWLCAALRVFGDCVLLAALLIATVLDLGIKLSG